MLYSHGNDRFLSGFLRFAGSHYDEDNNETTGGPFYDEGTVPVIMVGLTFDFGPFFCFSRA